MYVDVHAHLVHPRFAGREDQIARESAEAGVEYVIVNGLEPVSNRATLELCERHPGLLAALGIYPLDALTEVVDRSLWPAPFDPPERFSIAEELDFIEQNASRIVAVGECGLDLHWCKLWFDEQQRVLREVCLLARRINLPLILHTRAAERETFELVRSMGIERADFHCFGGSIELAIEIAEAGYHLSIPANVARARSFQKMAQRLPLHSLLTETDAPYLAPGKGEENHPRNVIGAVAEMARLRGIEEPEMATAIRANFRTLFGV